MILFLYCNACNSRVWTVYRYCYLLTVATISKLLAYTYIFFFLCYHIQFTKITKFIMILLDINGGLDTAPLP